MTRKIKLNTKISNLLQRLRSSHRNQIVLFVAVFIGIGSFLLLFSHAASPGASVEPEIGNLSAGVSSVPDGQASSGKYVKFQTATTPPPPPPDVTYGYRGTPGIPAGTQLRVINGDYTISANNVTLEAVHITGDLTITGNNATVRNSRIDGSGSNDYSVIALKGTNATIEHNQIGNSNNVLSGHHGVNVVGYGVTKILGNDIIHTHGGVLLWGDGLDSDSTLIQDNWVHNMTAQAGDHMNNISDECAANVTVDHNTLDGAVASGSPAGTAFSMSVYSDDQNCTVTKNSPYTKYDDYIKQTIHIGGLKNLTFTNNVAVNHGSFGLWFNDVIGTILVANNKVDDGGNGLWADPDFVPWTGYGNVNQNNQLYPPGDINN